MVKTRWTVRPGFLRPDRLASERPLAGRVVSVMSTFRGGRRSTSRLGREDSSVELAGDEAGRSFDVVDRAGPAQAFPCSAGQARSLGGRYGGRSARAGRVAARAGVSRCGVKVLTFASAARSGIIGSIPVGSCSTRSRAISASKSSAEVNCR